MRRLSYDRYVASSKVSSIDSAINSSYVAYKKCVLLVMR
jgi:hypothetical protein